MNTEHGRCMDVVREYVGTGYRIVASATRYYPDDVAPVVARIYMTLAPVGQGRIVWQDGREETYPVYTQAVDALQLGCSWKESPME